MPGRYFILAGLALTTLGCETDFNPKGPFLDRIVLYSVLTPASNRQIVRLETTYNPPGFNPLEHTSTRQIMNAQVSVSWDSSVVVLRDTLIQRNDGARYRDSIKAFVASPLTAFRGKTYAIAVIAPTYGTLTAATTVPGNGTVDVALSGRVILTNPISFREDIQAIAFVSSLAEGHRVQMYVEYEIASATPVIVAMEEVPIVIENQRDCLTFDAVYPILRRRTRADGQESWEFPHQNYVAILRKILKMHEGQMVNFRRVVLVLVQADRHLYRYSSLVNGFQDEFSIRVDQPNYTNVEGGLGLFGSFTLDSASIALPSSFSGLSCP
ncbi:MAG: DUF4249 family protein [Ignavibacteriales bacterium]|nr:DUF4249 family protein [Ignavibacteriales bacterium]